MAQTAKWKPRPAALTLSGMTARWSDQHRLPALLVGLIRAVLILLVTFGVAVTQAQQDSILELVGAVLAVMSLLLTGVTLARTTPVANPSLPEGTVVEVLTPEGQPNRTAVVV